MSRWYVKAKRTDGLFQYQEADTPAQAMSQAMANPNGWTEAFLQNHPEWVLTALEVADIPEGGHGIGIIQPHGFVDMAKEKAAEEKAEHARYDMVAIPTEGFSIGVSKLAPVGVKILVMVDEKQYWVVKHPDRCVVSTMASGDVITKRMD